MRSKTMTLTIKAQKNDVSLIKGRPFRNGLILTRYTEVETENSNVLIC